MTNKAFKAQSVHNKYDFKNKSLDGNWQFSKFVFPQTAITILPNFHSQTWENNF